jgi:hypothetical protein
LELGLRLGPREGLELGLPLGFSDGLELGMRLGVRVVGFAVGVFVVGFAVDGLRVLGLRVVGFAVDGLRVLGLRVGGFLSAELEETRNRGTVPDMSLFFSTCDLGYGDIAHEKVALNTPATIKRGSARKLKVLDLIMHLAVNKSLPLGFPTSDLPLAAE